jgi:hypothetical protein
MQQHNTYNDNGNTTTETATPPQLNHTTSQNGEFHLTKSYSFLYDQDWSPYGTKESCKGTSHWCNKEKGARCEEKAYSTEDVFYTGKGDTR